MDADHALHERSKRLDAKREIGERRKRHAQFAKQIGLRNKAIAQWQLAIDHGRARAGVDLGDLDAVRADLRADAAARAIIY